MLVIKTESDPECLQISEGPNPAIDDLSPDRGNVTFPVGHAVAHFTVLVRDDQVSS